MLGKEQNKSACGGYIVWAIHNNMYCDGRDFYVCSSVAYYSTCRALMATKYNANLSMFQMSFVYFILLLFLLYNKYLIPHTYIYIYSGITYRIRGAERKVAFWKFGICAIADSQGNFLLLKGFQCTTVTSVMILMIFSVPAALLFSISLLRVKYKFSHFIGCFVALLGIIIAITFDTIKNAQNCRYIYIYIYKLKSNPD